jgi:hypothetical protein
LDRLSNIQAQAKQAPAEMQLPDAATTFQWQTKKVRL